MSRERSVGKFTCSITLAIPFIEPVFTHPCGHLFDKKSLEKALQATPNSCPCCRGQVTDTTMSMHVMIGIMQDTLSEYPRYYNDVYFDLAHFKNVVQNDELRTPIGERFLTVLEHADNHLNNAIAILTSTRAGRDCLRKKLVIEKIEKLEDDKTPEVIINYFFGSAEIAPESLNIQVNQRSIREWLTMATDKEIKLEEIRQARQAATQIRFFASRLPISNRPYSNAVNPILQQVVYGEENNVKAALEAIKNDAAQLLTLVTHTGTAQAYSGCTSTNMTLLQAAAASGDVEMCAMLKEYMDQQEFTNQLTELFPEGIDVHYARMQQQAFDFDPILAAIKAASDTDLDAALSKQDNDSQLCRALDTFRQQFSHRSLTDQIFNPYLLLQAFEVYSAFADHCKQACSYGS